jgi:alkylated DNA repair dioxygenase AlkB
MSFLNFATPAVQQKPLSFAALPPLVLTLSKEPLKLSFAALPPLVLTLTQQAYSTNTVTPSLANIPPFTLNLNTVESALSTTSNSMKKEILIDADGALVFVIRNWLPQMGKQLLYKLQTEVKFERHPVNTPQGPVMQPRQIYACGDTTNVSGGSNVGGGDRKHNYSGLSLTLHKWVPEVKDIRDRIAKEFNFPADSCLINEYKDGKQSIGYHGDKETNGKYNNAVYTVSLGGTRDFCLKNNATGKVIKTPLNNGDLCAMLGTCQVLWKHSIPKRAKADARISLTYRRLGQ